jgi:integrase/recombinase XerD
MPTTANTRMTPQKSGVTTGILDDYLAVWIEAFLIDRKARGLSKNTVLFYARKLKQFADYCEAQAVKNISQITPGLLREFILWMQRDHNEGGVHAAYRAVRAFLLWYTEETDELTAIGKVMPPRVALEPLEGVSLETVLQLVKVSDSRDAAILLCLFDTGCRAREFLAVDLADVNQATGEILIRQSKSRKPRLVYLGRRSRKALRRYLAGRTDNNPASKAIPPHSGGTMRDNGAVWVTCDGDRLSYGGLRGVIYRRAKQAGIPVPALHDFRRGFALAMLRAGVDLYTLARLLGHEGIDVLKRYVKLTDTDTREAHRRASPVDNLSD